MKKRHLLGFLGLFLFPHLAAAKTDIEFVLDASGSMRAAMAGSTQMDVAKQTIKSTIATIPPDTNVALRVYAHRVEQADKAGSCVDTELLIPFGPLNAAAFSAKVDSIQPKGYTPIAYSLQQVGNDFGIDREAEKVVILVSDGEETCGGDPVQAVKDLIAKGFKLKLHAVGFNVDAKTQAQLQAIAAAGGGQYYDARDPAGLANSLKEITQKALLVQKTAAVYGAEIKGGDSYETSVPIAPGQEYRLNHHLKVNQFDYFYLDLKGGQALVVTMNTRQKGISVQGEKVTENDNPYAGFQIHDPTRKKIAGEELIGSPNQTRSAQVSVVIPQRLYLLVGSTYNHMHKDHPFKVEVKDLFDAGGGTDAGATPETALSIEKGKAYPENYLLAGDASDFYRFNTTKGETLTVKIIPENLDAVVRGVFYDDLRVELGKQQSPNRGAGVIVSAMATGPVTYLMVDRGYASADTKYSMAFEGTPTSSAMPTTGPPIVSPPPEVLAVAPQPLPPPPVLPPAPPPPPQVIVKEVPFSWTGAKALKVLGITFGSGFLVGVILTFWLSRKLRKKKVTNSQRP